MFKFCNLYSGSSGNCSYIESDNSKILVDCGVSAKKIEEALISLNSHPSELDGILITHEHSDHIKGLATLCKKYNVPIYSNRHTFDVISNSLKSNNEIHYFNNNDKFEVKDLEIHPFSISHDAVDPCAFSIIKDNAKISIATDIGHATQNVIDNLLGSSFVLLEANYEPDMLKSSKYPYSLKRRILGPDGHLSNDDAAQIVSYLVKSNTKKIMLGHLSEHNNFPELAYQTVMNSIIEKNIDISNISLSVASRSKVDKKIDV